MADLVVGLTLLVEKQFSFSLTMHKDLFAFLGIIVNLPDLSSSPNLKASKAEAASWPNSEIGGQHFCVVILLSRQ